MLILSASQQARPKPDTTYETQLINASWYLALRCSIRFVVSWFVASRLCTDWPLRSTDSATPLA